MTDGSAGPAPHASAAWSRTGSRALQVTGRLGGVTLTTPAAPRPTAWSAVLRWLLVSLVLTGVIAMHVLSQHDAAGGHHGSALGSPAAVAAAPDPHAGHAALAEDLAPRPAGTAVLMPAAPGGSDLSMTTCVLFLVIGAGTVLLAVLAALRRGAQRRAVRSAASPAVSVPRGPPQVGPPRISLCVLRV